MPQINCYLPIKLRIVGELSDAQLEQLGQTLVRSLRARLAFAERTIEARYNLAALSGATEVREAYDPAREENGGGRYQIPAYDQQGRPVSMRLQEQAPMVSRPWIIRKAINFHAPVGEFLDFVETLAPNRTFEEKVLYSDFFDELRWVSLWLVQVNQAYTLDQLEEILAARADQLSHRRSNQVLFYGMGTTEQIRRHLMALDKDGLVAQAMPNMQALNQMHTTGVGNDVTVLSGGWVLFASMVLPVIEAEDILTYDKELAISLPLHILDFIVKGESFERLFGTSWGNYISQYGDQPANLYILPFTTLRRTHFQTLKYLVEAVVAASVDKESAYFGNLYLLNQSRLAWLPPMARQQARSVTDDATLALGETQREGMWEPNWRGAFIYATLNPYTQQLKPDDLQSEAKIAKQREPTEKPEQLVSRFTSWGNLDEDGLGAYLVGLIQQSPALSLYVQRVLDELGTTDRDDVSLAFAQSASDADLDTLAHSPSGRLLLVRLFDELTSGYFSESEQQQAQRILAARVRSRSIELVAKRLAKSRGLIFPFRKPGPTVLDDAPIAAERLDDGRIRVTMPMHVKGTAMFHAETRTLPDEVFTSGLVLEADEWISVKLYDEGGIVVQQPALYLLELSNIETTSTLTKIVTTSVTALSFGLGGGAVAGGSRIVAFLDRAATAIGILGIIVDDHRGWIIETFGDSGRAFIKAVGVAQALAGIYGLGRVAFALPQVIGSLRSSWRNWRSSPVYQRLSGADLRRAEEISQKTEQFLNDMDDAAAAMRREAGPGSTESPGPIETPTTPLEPGTVPSPAATRPPSGAIAPLEEAPPVILYRGTVYRFVGGRSRQVHDLGDGVYMTFEPELAVRYAQLRRVEVQALEPGAPGVVLRVEAEPSELGRALDFYNDRALRADWETFLQRQPGGDIVLRGGPAEMYNAHFENWLRSRGTSLEQFDVIIGPEYIRGGSQVCIRNESIAERLLSRAEEWARAHEPVTPAYPEMPVPRLPTQ